MVRACDGGDRTPITFRQYDSVISMLNLAEKKKTALLAVVQKIIARYQNASGCGQKDEKIFVLFERAKEIDRAKTDKELSEAITDMLKV